MVAPKTVIHFPHAATEIPADLNSSFVLSDTDLQNEILRMTDWFTDEFFALGESQATQIRYPVSRLVLAPERFEDDSDEPMAKIGMGVIYERTIEGDKLRASPTPEEREALLERFYRPHHAALTRAVDEALVAHGMCIVIDAHSFPAIALAYELDAHGPRPDICIGTDPVHTDEEFVKLAIELFERAGFTTSIDRPFAGALVPTKHYRKNADVLALMIEVNRGLYMDEATGHRSSDFGEVREQLQGVLRDLVEIWGDGSFAKLR